MPAAARPRPRASRWRLKDAISLANDNAIAFHGEVVRLLPKGGRRVRLDNGHVLTVLAAREMPSRTVLIGDVVRVELGVDEMEGWRLLPPLSTNQQDGENDGAR